MLTTRVIPALLLKGGELVKTRRFSRPVYIGDPINAIKIFNTKEVDELIVLDITASRQGRPPAFDVIRSITDECFMPLAFGGGIRSLDDMRRILKAGVEKVVLNHAALSNPELVSEAAKEFGSQAVIVSIDVKNKPFRGHRVFSSSGARIPTPKPVEWAKRLEELGAGEIYLTSVDREGTQTGYDLDLVRDVCSSVNIPVISSGGARTVEDFAEAKAAGASAAAAGAMFVFQGPHRAVLITYPSRSQLERALT